MKVGDTLYIFDTNTRHYTRPKDGRIWGDMIYAKHFRPKPIIGETFRSWIIQGPGGGTKLNKKTLVSAKDNHSGFRVRAFTKEQMEDDIYCHEHANPLAEKVRYCKDVETLMAVEALFAEGEV